jgi:GTP 3',8-cyclase
MVTDKLQRVFRDLRISVTDRCNFRCAYCMPEEIYGEKYKFLARERLLTFEEITRLTRLLVKLGAVKIRLTGGEPLLRKDVELLVGQLAKIEGIEDFAMTSNGYLMPQKAQILKDAGLHRVTISLDSLDDDIFRQMNGNKAGVKQVLEGIETAQQAGLTPIKINAVVQRGVNDHTIVDLARYCKERGYILRFIEYMDAGNLNGWKLEHVVPAAEMVAMISAEMPLEAIDSNYHGEVARRYKYQDGEGELGLITSVTNAFCGGCTRLRLSPEGRIYTCLFGMEGIDLRQPLRSGANDDEIANIITNTWKKRTDRYSELRAELPDSDQPKVEMHHIGG